MGVFMQDYNRFIVNSTPTLYSLNFLNPFHPMVTMAVTIEYPLLPLPQPNDEPQPEYTINDYYAIGFAHKPFLEDGENGIFWFTFDFLKQLAINNISYKNLDTITWKFLVSLYIAHYMEMFIRDFKDEANKSSTEPELVEKDYHMKNLDKVGDNEFRATSYGLRFWHKYEAIGSWTLKGTNYKRIKHE